MAGIAVEALPNEVPPQVGITITGLDPGAPSTIRVDVSWDGVTWTSVRGALSLTVTGDVFLRDHVPPLNVQAAYRLTVLAGTTIPDTLSASTLVPSSTMWVQNPLSPHDAFPVVIGALPSDGRVGLLDPALGSASWQQHTDTAVPEGASLPVASVSTRLRAADVVLTLGYIQSVHDGTVRNLLMSTGPVVIRGLPVRYLLDDVAHVVLGDLTETRLDYGNRQITTWALTARSVRASAQAIAVPWWTYQAVVALWAPSTYDQVKAARPGATYLDWQRDPRVP